MKKIWAVIIMSLMPLAIYAQKDNKLETKANGGDIDAMLRMADCYEWGSGVEQDSSKALTWLQKAADKGSGEAWTRISYYYLRGSVVKADTLQCLSIRKKWADAGNGDALSALSRCYMAGYGVEADTAKALQLLEESVKKGSRQGYSMMGDTYAWGNSGVKKDQKKAIEHWKKALKGGELFAGIRLSDKSIENKDYKAAWQYIAEGLKWSHPQSVGQAAMMHFYGIGVAKDELKAQRMFSDLMSKFHDMEYYQYMAGLTYLSCDEVSLRDTMRAIKYWKEGAEHNMNTCTHALAELYTSIGDYANGKKYFRQVTEGKDNYLKDEACYNLSQIYYEGLGEEAPDSLKAISLLHKGADKYKGEICCATLAAFYADNTDSIMRAVEYYKRAIEYGKTSAYANLAFLYWSNNLKSKAIETVQEMIDKGDNEGYYTMASLYADNNDDAKTLEWLEKGAKKNEERCCTALGNIYHDGLKDGKPNMKKAESYYLKSNGAEGLYRAGLMYLRGELGKQNESDMKKGMDYLRQSADMGYIDAISTIGYCYETGSGGVEKDYTESLKYYRKLADNNIGYGLFKMGLYYELGDGGVEKDSTKAIYYYRRAADLGNGTAMCYLGDFHRIGHFLPLDKKKALEYYQAAAESGDATGIYYTGRSYLEGCGVDIDTAAALPYLQQASDMEIGNASFLIAEFYNHGKGGMPADGDSAAHYYLKAYNDGNAHAGYIIAIMLIQENNYEAAFDYLVTSARRGDEDATVLYATYMQNGIAMEADPKTAYEIFSDVADKTGNALAYYQMGMAKLTGNGTPQSEVAGKEYLETAAKKGHSNAMNTLAICYLNGYGCAPDTNEAIMWLRKSVASGNIKGCNQLGDLYEDMEAFDSAVYYYQKAVDAGSAEGCCNLGYMYEKGRGVILSYKKAYNLYMQAAEMGYPRGYLMVAFCYLEGISVEEDYPTALQWFIKAAEGGNVMAMHNAGALYEAGEKGIIRDVKKARYWYSKAAEEGYEPSKVALKNLK